MPIRYTEANPTYEIINMYITIFNLENYLPRTKAVNAKKMAAIRKIFQSPGLDAMPPVFAAIVN